MKYLLILIAMLICAGSVIANNQSNQTNWVNQQQARHAQRSQECGREYTNCQSQCVHVELVDSNNNNANGGSINCNPKNNRIAQCRNQCYTNMIFCRGGK